MSNTKQKSIIRFKDDEFIKRFYAVIASSGKLKISGLGIFEVRPVKERDGYNIGDGKTIRIPAHNKVLFRATKKLRDIIQKKQH